MANRKPATAKEVAGALSGAQLKINKSAGVAAFVKAEGNLQVVKVWCSREMSAKLLAAKTPAERLKVAQKEGAFFVCINDETGEEFLRFECIGNAKWE